MRAVKTGFLIAFCAIIHSFPIPTTAGKPLGDIIVRVTGVETLEGKILISLHDSDENFGEKGSPFRWSKKEASHEAEEIVFESVPYGNYAIRLFHDANDNDKLDFTFYGYPKEQFGFSNNPKVRFGPPGFEKARFSLNQPSLELDVALQ